MLVCKKTRRQFDFSRRASCSARRDGNFLHKKNAWTTEKVEGLFIDYTHLYSMYRRDLFAVRDLSIDDGE